MEVKKIIKATYGYQLNFGWVEHLRLWGQMILPEISLKASTPAISNYWKSGLLRIQGTSLLMEPLLSLSILPKASWMSFSLAPGPSSILYLARHKHKWLAVWFFVERNFKRVELQINLPTPAISLHFVHQILWLKHLEFRYRHLVWTILVCTVPSLP